MASFNIEDTIIYEDAEILVCHKPAGVLSQADRSFAVDMVSALLARERKKGNNKPFVAPVNRLDRPVEGLILFAKNNKAAANLTRQIVNSEVDKCYYAVVDIEEESVLKSLFDCRDNAKKNLVTLIDYLYKDPKTNTSRVVNIENEENNNKDGSQNKEKQSMSDAGQEIKEAKKAVLDYLVISINGKKALLDVKLHTGRHHQIRVQLSNAGMPLAGDTKYNRKYADVKGWVNIALCSYRMEFKHPVNGKKMQFKTTPKGDEFKEFLSDHW